MMATVLCLFCVVLFGVSFAWEEPSQSSFLETFLHTNDQPDCGGDHVCPHDGGSCCEHKGWCCPKDYICGDKIGKADPIDEKGPYCYHKESNAVKEHKETAVTKEKDTDEPKGAAKEKEEMLRELESEGYDTSEGIDMIRKVAEGITNLTSVAKKMGIDIGDLEQTPKGDSKKLLVETLHSLMSQYNALERRIEESDEEDVEYEQGEDLPEESL